MKGARWQRLAIASTTSYFLKFFFFSRHAEADSQILSFRRGGIPFRHRLVRRWLGKWRRAVLSSLHLISGLEMRSTSNSFYKITDHGSIWQKFKFAQIMSKLQILTNFKGNLSNAATKIAGNLRIFRQIWQVLSILETNHTPRSTYWRKDCVFFFETF